jgi:hypothetical protein
MAGRVVAALGRLSPEHPSSEERPERARAARPGLCYVRT